MTEKRDSLLTRKQMKYQKNIAYTSAIIGLSVTLLMDMSLRGLVMGIATGVGFGLLVGIICALMIGAYNFSIDAASERKTPFGKVFAFLIALILFVSFIDFMFLRATYIITPAATLVFTGKFGESYWGCRENWIVADEGSFCDPVR